MFSKLLPNVRVVDPVYSPELHTYKMIADGKIAMLSKKSFPDHTAIPFLDDSVQVLESVYASIKDEKTLRSEGWANYLKTSLKHPKHPFLIGKDKKTVLGTIQKGKIGINKSFQPYFFMDGGWRFSPNELFWIIKSETIPLTKDAQWDNFKYVANAQELYIPGMSGRLNHTQIMSLKRTLKMAGIV